MARFRFDTSEEKRSQNLQPNSPLCEERSQTPSSEQSTNVTEPHCERHEVRPGSKRQYKRTKESPLAVGAAHS